MKTALHIIAGLGLAAGPLLAGDISLKVVAKGIQIEAGSVGNFVIEAPELTLSTGEKEKPEFEATSEKAGVAKYASGTVLDFQVSGNEIDCQYSTQGEAQAVTFRMLVPINFNQGGKFAFGDKELKDFPAEKTGQFVDTGSSHGSLTLVDPEGAGFTVNTPTNWYGLQDNRVFNWEVFSYDFLYDFKAFSGKNSLTITIEPYKKS